MSGALTKLTIAHLRGAVESFELPFERGKKLTIIYGENGTGKSTICDALEFLSKGRVGSLDNRGLGKTTKYWNTISKTPSDISVTLDAVDGICRGTMGRSDAVVHPPDARPRVEVLRRSQILDLLEATPANRYAAISRFIDVSGIETSEQNLRYLIRDLNRGLDIAAARISENLDAIDQFWKAAGNPGTDALVWARAEVGRIVEVSDSELDVLRKLQSAYERLIRYPNDFAALDDSLQSAQNDVDVAHYQLSSSLSAATANTTELLTLLQAARTYLYAKPYDDICPLCEQPDKTQNLIKQVEMRLDALDIVCKAKTSSDHANALMDQVKQRQKLFIEQMLKDVAAFMEVSAQFDWSPDIPLPSTQPPTTPTDLASWLAATADLPERWNSAESIRQDRYQFLTTLRSALKTYTENLESQQDLNTLLPKLQRALEIVENERKTFTDSILSKIAGEVGRLYEIVHPGEGLNKISLELDAAKRASLEIAASFAGKSGPPQAYFSQSHLDTLGLCVFIALANLDDPKNTIMVLDDVLTSVDEPHIERLIGMLYNEALKFRHCIITTHYGPWKYKHRWGWLKNGQCHFVELTRWTSTNGMGLIRSVPEVERLRLLLEANPPDPQLVCAKAGVILEAALDFLTQLYECSVPRKPEPRYTLGELLPAIKSKLRKALRVEVLKITDGFDTPRYHMVDLEPILNELERIAQARNVFGCHFNAISFDLLESDAMIFGQQVLRLIETLADPEVGWPRNSKSGSYWANAGETRRLYPLKQPS